MAKIKNRLKKLEEYIGKDEDVLMFIRYDPDIDKVVFQNDESVFEIETERELLEKYTYYTNKYPDRVLHISILPRKYITWLDKIGVERIPERELYYEEL